MTQKPDQPLRGDAAWKAAKADVEQRNKAARQRGSELRAADDRERENLPEQPHP
jgi:hypothetical protein